MGQNAAHWPTVWHACPRHTRQASTYTHTHKHSQTCTHTHTDISTSVEFCVQYGFIASSASSFNGEWNTANLLATN